MEFIVLVFDLFVLVYLLLLLYQSNLGTQINLNHRPMIRTTLESVFAWIPQRFCSHLSSDCF